MTLARYGPLFGVILLILGAHVSGQAEQPRAPATRAPHAEPPGRHHGTPPGWKFAWPKGDAAKGRDVFAKLECYSCHEVKGERFPGPSQPGSVGPELSAMGPLHEPEYFAESVLNPSAVIEKGKGYQAPDRSSKMPSFNDVMTVQELIDLVAYLRSLRPAPGAGGGHRGH